MCRVALSSFRIAPSSQEPTKNQKCAKPAREAPDGQESAEW